MSVTGVLGKLAETSRYLWNSLPDTGCTTNAKVRINQWAASTFLFSLDPNDPQLKREEGYFQQFWKGCIPERHINNEKIKDLYHAPQDKECEIALSHATVTWTCSVTRLKKESENVFNLVYIAGKDCTRNSTYMPIYPYLEGLANQTLDIQYNVIFIAGFDISHNNDRYIPSTMSETGLLLKNVLCQISKEMGAIDQVIVHSLGGIMFGASLPCFTGPALQHFPKSVLFDRCPASMYGAAKNVAFGRIGFGIASLTGEWDLNLETTIADFQKTNSDFFKEKGIKFVFADAMDDHYFTGTWLGLAKEITNCTERCFVTMQFRIPHGGLNRMAQHALPASSYYGGRVVTGDIGFLNDNETLAEGIIRHSFKERKKEHKNDG